MGAGEKQTGSLPTHPFANLPPRLEDGSMIPKLDLTNGLGWSQIKQIIGATARNKPATENFWIRREAINQNLDLQTQICLSLTDQTKRNLWGNL